MPIMSHDEWMRRTRLGAFKPRSQGLKLLDAAIKAYGQSPGSPPHFETLKASFVGWAQGKADAENSERNGNGAVTDLMNQILDFQRQHQPAQQLRPAALMADIREGARLMSQGALKPQIRVALSTGTVDRSLGNVVYEDFDPQDMTKARKAWSDAHRCSQLALEGIAQVGNSDAEEERFRRWFGRPDADRVAAVRDGLQAMRLAFTAHKVTMVNRADIQVHMVNGNDPFGPMVATDVNGSGVYGYVWGGEHTGSGYRVIMGKWFLQDPDPIEGAAQTIYHELTHKVLRTVDHGYGKVKSRGFATAQPQKAVENADNWAFYAVSFIKAI